MTNVTTEPRKTFWEGYRAEDNERIHKAIPDSGACDKRFKAVENFRVFSNMYYRFHNDGDTPNHQAFNKLARIAREIDPELGILDGEVMLSYHSKRSVGGFLEAIGEPLTDAAVAELDQFEQTLVSEALAATDELLKKLAASEAALKDINPELSRKFNEATRIVARSTGYAL